MKYLFAGCVLMVWSGCAPATHTVFAPVYIPEDAPSGENAFRIAGVQEPHWYDEEDASAPASAWSGRAQVLVEAKLVNWTSQERFAECQGMARFRKLDDGGFKRMTEQEARGILGGHWADRCITPPSISLYDGQSSWVAVTTGMPANCETPCVSSRDLQGTVVFAKPTNVASDGATLAFSAQATCPHSPLPPAGFRRALLRAEGEQTMPVGEWFIRLAESEDQRTPTALMVRIAQIRTPGEQEPKAAQTAAGA